MGINPVAIETVVSEGESDDSADEIAARRADPYGFGYIEPELAYSESSDNKENPTYSPTKMKNWLKRSKSPISSDDESSTTDSDTCKKILNSSEFKFFVFKLQIPKRLTLFQR